MHSFKEKLNLIGSSIFLFFLSLIFIFFGCYSTYNLFLFERIINYSFGFSLCIFLPSVLFIMSFEIFYFAMKGMRLSQGTMKILWRIIKVIIIFSILFSVLFSFFYRKELLSRGYVICNGIPSGWMPGMATKYAINESLCHKK